MRKVSTHHGFSSPPEHEIIDRKEVTLTQSSDPVPDAARCIMQWSLQGRSLPLKTGVSQIMLYVRRDDA